MGNNMDKKIGWQKYEDVIQTEMYSPLASIILEELNTVTEEDEDEYEQEMHETESLIVPKNFYETVSLMSRFDCWIGHTNFNLKNSIKNKLNEVDGIEVLNIISRYRFFIGIGKMFKFTEVRKDIEKTICSKGETIESRIKESPSE
jgi:hypothetical protein